MNRFCKVLPSAVSALRLGLGIAIFLCAIKRLWLAVGIMAVTGIVSDWLDGWLAFRLDARTRFGALIDPPCDFVFAAGLVAGAVFTGTITWIVVGWMAILFVVTWMPVVLTKDPLRKVTLTINRTYYVLVIFGLTTVYFGKAIGPRNVALLSGPALILAAIGLRSSSSHH
jgi:cardiolipin synthase